MHRGSLQYWHHRRAQRRLPRQRSYPRDVKDTALLSLVAYKAGMSHVTMTDDSESPSKNMEVSRACTILEVPRMEVYGARLYKKEENTNYRKSAVEILSKASAQKLGIKAVKRDETKLPEFKSRLKDFVGVSVLVAAYPDSISVEQHHPMRFEAPVGGKSLEEKFDYAGSLLGKEISAAQVFKDGEHIDVLSISTGKGWAGTIKRFGTARLSHKATQKVRHIGALGAFSPGKVMFTVPQAGQLGFNYRTEHNKRILKMGPAADSASVVPRAGFKNYGVLHGDYIILDGSVPGPAKRLLRIRKSITNRDAKGVKAPKISGISV